jgi:Polyprenyl synthetase
MAFQLVDDLLDFVATSAQLGKPAAADLRLGLATAPVLFAAQKVFLVVFKHIFIIYYYSLFSVP